MMDQPDLAADHHQRALAGLARINWISLSDGILWRPLRRLAAEHNGRPLRVLDIATGGGDVPIRLSERARRAGLAMEFAGADISPVALGYARNQARARGASVDFFQTDVLRDPLPTGYDALISSLFLHHLSTGDAAWLLGHMAKAARRVVLINDLIRSPVGYLLARSVPRVLTSSPVVHVDSVRSVAAAFTMPEALALAQQAGLHGATIGWRWPFRYLLSWRRQP